MTNLGKTLKKSYLIKKSDDLFVKNMIYYNNIIKYT